MDLDERIERRRRGESERALVRDFDVLSPVTHLTEPNGRGPVLERLLDVLDPTFGGDLPDDAYVWGPKGTGKSAVVSALFGHLSERNARRQSTILTTTRAVAPPATLFVYVDARDASSEFALYHDILDSVVDESVPEGGVGTDDLRDRLGEELSGTTQAVVAVDHVNESNALTTPQIDSLLDMPSMAYLVVGRDPPDADVPGSDESVAARVDETIEVPHYERHALVDILTQRASLGLARNAVSHTDIREVASWADGDAHDALAVVFGAADHALERGDDRITTDDIEVGMDAVPWPSVSLGRVLALPENRRRILRRLLELDASAVSSVTAATDALTADPHIDLSATTIKRVLYELAEAGVVKRIETDDDDDRGLGRPPSRLEPQFPTRVFRRLVDIDD
ncbi:AAA family ATPase [Salinigranum rubrum]|uniref:AAA family ATPase n=1 Tax=Salinigranum rubrum TaxID=755307 RepID=A0A2I8VIR6_9EURY|nr:AAA family ATPase [Salinigranum rubrum]AUV81833.1 AAA family ATPase [Salinigranum rubrum]